MTQLTPVEYRMEWYRSDKYKTDSGEVVTLPKGQRFAIGPHVESASTIVVRLQVGNFFFNGHVYSQSFQLEPKRVAEQIEEAKRNVVKFRDEAAALKAELREVRKQKF